MGFLQAIPFVAYTQRSILLNEKGDTENQVEEREEHPSRVGKEVSRLKKIVPKTFRQQRRVRLRFLARSD